MANDTISVESLVSGKSGLPLVKMTWGENGCQMTPEEARRHAYGILDAANAAESDSLIYRFLVTKVGLKQEQAIAVFRDFRQLRENQVPLTDGLHKFKSELN